MARFPDQAQPAGDLADSVEESGMQLKHVGRRATGSGSGAWSDGEVDLSGYAGQNVRVGFLFSSEKVCPICDKVGAG